MGQRKMCLCTYTGFKNKTSVLYTLLVDQRVLIVQNPFSIEIYEVLGEVFLYRLDETRDIVTKVEENNLCLNYTY